MDLSVFNAIAANNSWGSEESVSGPGSTLDATATLRRSLPDVLARLGVRTLVDAPCGDMNWMRHLQASFDSFIGVDIVPSIVDRLRAQSFPDYCHFQTGNIVTDVLPQADALFCRDCLVHLPNEMIRSAVALWRRAGFRFVFTTTFYKKSENVDIRPGEWRPLNLAAPPFNWPQPIYMILDNDGLPEPYDDKVVGVWSVRALP